MPTKISNATFCQLQRRNLNSFHNTYIGESIDVAIRVHYWQEVEIIRVNQICDVTIVTVHRHHLM